MFFPELTSRIAGLLSRFSTGPDQLSIVGPPEASKSVVSMSPASGTEWYARNGYDQIFAALGGGQASWSGESVSVNSALNHSVVWACNRLISETLGFIPLVMMQEKAEADDKQLAVKHPTYRALKYAVNDEMTSMTWRETSTSHCLLQGKTFSRILRRSGGGQAFELQLLQPGQVNVDRDAAKRLIYEVKDGNAAAKTYTVERGKPHDIFHLRNISPDGINGYSVIRMGAQSLGTALAAEKHVGSFYARGGRLPYVLEMANKFKTKEDFDKFRADWELTYSVPHRAPILENDIKYKAIGLTAEDAQLLETRLFSIHEVCRWFGVPPHLVGDLSRATFNNIEQLALEFVKLTLSAWFTRWEQELYRCILTPAEKEQGYIFKHNANALLRGDFMSRMQGYAIMLQNGIASQNEIRDLEDWNPFPGGDNHHIQLNMQALPEDGTVPGAADPAKPKGTTLIRLDRADNAEAAAVAAA